jgi:hypothetical protein
VKQRTCDDLVDDAVVCIFIIGVVAVFLAFVYAASGQTPPVPPYPSPSNCAGSSIHIGIDADRPYGSLVWPDETIQLTINVATVEGITCDNWSGILTLDGVPLSTSLPLFSDEHPYVKVVDMAPKPEYVARVENWTVLTYIPWPCPCWALVRANFNVVTPDIDDDDDVDADDLMQVIDQWGVCPDPCVADIVHDGQVDVTDLIAVIGAWT